MSDLEEARTELRDLMYVVHRNRGDLSLANSRSKRILELAREFPSLFRENCIHLSFGNRTVLSILIELRAPLELIQGIVEAAPESVRTRDPFRLPIHTACLCEVACCREQEDYADVIIYLSRKYPAGLVEKYANYEDMLPIHRLVEGRGSNLKAIQVMAQINPNLISWKDKSGCLPLHYACTASGWGKGDAKIISYLATFYPEGLRQLSMLPTTTNRYFEYGSKALPIHLVLANKVRRPPRDVIELFLDLYPDSLRVADSMGCLPLAIALDGSPRMCDFGLVRDLAKKFPEALNVTDPTHSHQLPIHMLISMSAPLDLVQEFVEMYPDCLIQKTKKDGIRHGHTPLHFACQTRSSYAIIEYLARKNPLAVKIPADDGKLPLHSSIYCGPIHMDRLDTVRLLVELCPESLTWKDRFGRLPLHIACFKNSSDVISYLCQEHTQATQQAAREAFVDANSSTVASSSSSSHMHIPPLYELLKSNGPKLEDVKRLVEIYPESIWQSTASEEEKGVCALTYACGGNDVSIFDYCCKCFPKTQESLVLRGHGFHLDDYVTGIVGLLPQLKTFQCFPEFNNRGGWNSDFGWRLLVNGLRGNTSIVNLALNVPLNLLSCGNRGDRFARAILQGGSLQELEIRLKPPVWRTPQECKSESNVANFVLDILGENQLSSLVVTGEDVGKGEAETIYAILGKLCGNTRLTKLSVPSLSLDMRQLKALLRILKKANMTLMQLDINNAGALETTLPLDAALVQIADVGNLWLNIRYFLNLNRAGRAQARDPNTTISGLARLLPVRGNKLFTDKLDHFNVCYGLLSETVSIWSGSSAQGTGVASGSRKRPYEALDAS